MGSYLVKLIRDYSYPPSCKEVIDRAEIIGKSVNGGNMEISENIGELMLLQSYQISRYKKGMVAGAAVAALGACTYYFGPELTSHLWNSDYSALLAKSAGLATGWSGLAHITRNLSLSLDIKDSVSDGINSAMQSMETPERLM